MKPSKPFTLPRGKIDPDEDDHDASAIAFKAPLPKASDTTIDPSTEFIPNPTSKIGRRQWKDDNADPWQFNAWSVCSSLFVLNSCHVPRLKRKLAKKQLV
jgi:hypothetical protein